MTPLENVMEVQKLFPLRDGWNCVDLSPDTVTMEHPQHGRRVCHVHRPGKVHVREVARG